MGDGRQKTLDRRQEIGDGRREAGGERQRQEARDRRQKIGGKRQEVGAGRWETGDGKLFIIQNLQFQKNLSTFFLLKFPRPNHILYSTISLPNTCGPLPNPIRPR